MALYDPVTALPNRIHFKREADRLLKARGPGERVALLFIDLDGFKEVNDNLGHAQGHHELILVANRRSERRRVGTECVTTCRHRWWTDHKKQKTERSRINNDQQ